MCTHLPATVATEERFRTAYGCFQCDTLGASRATVGIIVQALAPILAAHPHIDFEVFDIGPGSAEGFVSKYNALIAKNYSFILFEPLPAHPSVMTMLRRLHAANPALRVVVQQNHVSLTEEPWLAQYGIRFDEMGYLSGFIAGTLSKKGRVAIIYPPLIWALSRLMATGAIAGVRDACPHCVIDLQFEQNFHGSMYRSETYADRGADVHIATGAPMSFGLHKPSADGTPADNTTSVHSLFDLREYYLPPALRHRVPYVVPQLVDGWGATLLASAARGEEFRSGLFLFSVESESIGLYGCTKDTMLPCNDTGVSPSQQTAILKVFEQFKRGDGRTLTSLNADATTVTLTFPRVRAGMVRSLRDAAGDRTTWRCPVPVHLGNFKIALLAAPFSDLWTYVYFAHAMAHFPTDLHALDSRKNFAAVGFDTFAILVGGADHHSEFARGVAPRTLRSDVVRVQHECGGVPESCTMNPAMTVISHHPAGPREHACVARLGTDMLFVHGGVSSDAVLDDTYLMNVTSGQWTKVANGPIPRHSHTCTNWEIQGGGRQSCALVIGGSTTDGSAVSHPVLFCLNGATPSWVETTGFGPDAIQLPCVFAADDRMVLFGGQRFPASNTTWVLTPWYAWVPATGWRHDAMPRGPMHCLDVHQHDEYPKPQTHAGVFDAEAVMAFHRVHVFPLVRRDGEYFSASSDMTLALFPRVECATNLALMPDGLGCTSALDESAAIPTAMTALVVLVVIPIVAALLAMHWRKVQRRAAKLADATRFLPTGPTVAMAAVQLRFVREPPEGVSRGHLFARMSGKLHRIAGMYHVYEVSRFADTVTYACDHPQRLCRMLLKQFDYVHRDFHGCTLATSMHYGPAVMHGVAPRCRFDGAVACAIHAMVALCPHGAVLCSHQSLARVSESVLERCKMGDSVEIPNPKVKGIVLHPTASNAVAAILKEELAQREAEELSMKRSSVTHSGDGTHNDMSVLFLRELFRSMKSVRTRDTILYLLFARFEIPQLSSHIPLRKRRVGRSDFERQQRMQAVCHAIARELHEPILAVREMHKAARADGSSASQRNPLFQHSVFPSVMATEEHRTSSSKEDGQSAEPAEQTLSQLSTMSALL